MRAVSLAILALCVFAVPISASTAPVFTTASKGKFTVEIAGTGFAPNMPVKIDITDPDGQNTTIDTPPADASGNFSHEYPNLLSTGAVISPGDTLHAIQGATDVTIKVVKDTTLLDWLIGLVTDAGPLRTDFHTTDLAAAGFAGTVDLIGVSSNASIVSEKTTYDPATDSITTIGFYNALALGPVIGTYRAVGTFSNLFNDAGQPLTGVQVFTDSSDRIGIIVPEPATWATVLMGFGMAGIALRRRQAHKA